MRTNTLQAIAYVSTAVGRPDAPTLQHLLDRARARNTERGVTGLLLYRDGSFMQDIEGLPDSVAEIYQIICLDRLHHGLMELLNEPIEAREFGDWAMAYDAQTMPAFLAPLRRRSGAGSSSGDTPLLGPGRQLLQTVWRDARHRLS